MTLGQNVFVKVTSFPPVMGRGSGLAGGSSAAPPPQSHQQRPRTVDAPLPRFTLEAAEPAGPGTQRMVTAPQAAGTPAGGAPPSAAADAPSRRPGREWDSILPPSVHLFGGPRGDVTAELSARRIQWVDRLNAYTVRNLVSRVFLGRPEDGGRLIRSGCLFSDAARAGF